ncbi:hypothetical protein Q3G72_034193 [Acer saccharum]|nr:hypothetical protein Q3G72_034193 [Acer saccharum]
MILSALAPQQARTGLKRVILGKGHTPHLNNSVKADGSDVGSHDSQHKLLSVQAHAILDLIAGQLCPPGIEGTLFALFMSINNFGSTVGSFVGVGLASVLNISSGSFDNLLSGIVIQVICTFIPIAFLFLIPKEATGVLT